MAVIDYQQSSFNAGELSPLVKGREGLEKYGSGLKTCENALVLAHGPVTSRGGFRYIGDVKTHSKEVKLIPFEFNEDQAYVLEMGNEYMRVWMDGGQIVTPDSYTVLLLHMDGYDTSVSFTDKSPNGHVVTVNGNAQVDTDDPVYTTGDEPGNLMLDGDGDYLSIADHADFHFGTAALTIDTWFYLDSVVGVQCIYYQRDTATEEAIALWVDLDTDKIYFVDTGGGSTQQISFTYSTGFAIDTWYHIALIRGWGGNANDWMVTINGVACGSAQTANMTLPDYGEDPQLGAAENTFIPDHSPENHIILCNGTAIENMLALLKHKH